MNSNRLTVPRNRDGLYLELAVVNETKEDVVLISQSGIKDTIAPRTPIARNTSNELIIFICKRIGKACDDKGHLIIPDTVMTRVHVSKFSDAPYFCTEINTVIATTNASEYAEHPASCAKYDKVVDDALASIAGNDSIRITVNYPDHPPTDLYCALMGSILKITTTNLIATGPTLSVYSTLGGESTLVATHALAPLASLETESITNTSLVEPIVIGRTHQGVSNTYQEYKHTYLTLPRSEFTTYLDDHTAAYRLEVQDKMDMQDRELAKTIRERDEKSQEVDNLRAQLGVVQGALESSSAVRRFGAQSEMMDYKRDEQVHKSSRAAISAGTETAKFVSTTVKIVGGVAIGIAAAVFAPTALLAGLFFI